MDQEQSFEHTGQSEVERQQVQAECGMCGRLLDEEVDDLFVELCRKCESNSLKMRQARGRVSDPHPRRF